MKPFFLRPKGFWHYATKTFINLAGLCIIICTEISCDNFIEVDPPNSQLTGTVVFKDKATANAAIVSIYSRMRDSGLLTGQASGISCTLGLYSDELDYYQDIGSNNFYTNSLIPETIPVKDLWNNSYNIIYASNAVSEGMSESNISSQDRDRLKGESFFIRALMHFYLVNLFGDIPYITSTDYAANRKVKRLSTEDVYKNLIEDLTRAQQLLPQEDTSLEKVRPIKAAATALLSRVYLYSGKYIEAASSASSIINDPAYILDTDLDKMFLKESRGTIFQFSPAATGRNTSEASLYIFSDGPPPVVALTKSLVTAFEAGDRRRQLWIKEVMKGNVTWYHSYKYKIRTTAGSSKEYSIVLRLGEQYLIRAEARARQGDLAGAKVDLDRIRSNAGLAANTAVSQEEVLDAVLKERRSELFTEFGHRFMDLKRFEKLDAVLSDTKPGWNTNDKLWPVPTQEIIANPNLNPQNSGY